MIDNSVTNWPVAVVPAPPAVTVKAPCEVTVPANSVVDIVDKNSSLYLQETDLLRGGASAGSTVDVVVSYETLID